MDGNRKLNDNKKMLIVIVAFVLVIVFMVSSATYAMFQATASKGGIGGSANCYTINYVKGQDITGELQISGDYTSGKSTDVVIYSEPDCATLTGTIYITTNQESIMDFSDNALRYTVVSNNAVVAEGAINGTVNQPIYDNFVLNTTATTYKVYIWLDETLEDYGDLSYESYSGFIHADVKGSSDIIN